MHDTSRAMRKVLLDQAAILVAVCILCGVIQYSLLNRAGITPSSPLWHLPVSASWNSGREICIRYLCGGASLLLFIGAPLLSMVSAIGYARTRRQTLQYLAKSRNIHRLDDPLFRLQYGFIFVALFSEAFLGGPVARFFVGDNSTTTNVLLVQSSYVVVAFVSSSVMTLSDFAKQARENYFK